jgi:hypothetical protein
MLKQAKRETSLKEMKKRGIQIPKRKKDFVFFFIRRWILLYLSQKPCPAQDKNKNPLKPTLCISYTFAATRRNAIEKHTRNKRK